MNWRLTFFAVFIGFLTILSVAPVRGAPDGAGVGVLNVPPTFSYVHFSSADGIHWVEVNVSDYNSWMDIYQIKLIFTADDGPITVITYTQYSNRSDMSSRVDWFNETYGHYLIQKDTRITYRVFNGTTVTEKCNMNISFAFRPIEALKVVMIVEDLGGVRSISTVDYPPLFGGIPMEQEPISTDLIAIVLSTFGTAAGIKVKYGSFTKPIKNLKNGVKEVTRR